MATTLDRFPSYWYLLVTFVIAIFLLRILFQSFLTKTRRHPPSPPALPIIGHLHLLSARLPKSLETLATRYGPIMQVLMGGTPITVVTDANIAKEILKTNDADFASKYPLGFGLSKFDIYYGCSFVNAQYGPYWRFMKKLCMTQLFAGTQLDRLIHIREQETLKFLESLMQKAREGKPCELGKELTSLANSIICRMAMGKKCAENPNLPAEIRRLLQGIMEYAAKMSFFQVFGPLKRLDLSGNGKKLVSTSWEYDKLLEKIMKDYLDDLCDKEGRDVMDILLETYRDPDAEIKLTREHIKNFFQEIFFAGVDTTAAAIQYAFLELIDNPMLFEKLRGEINSVVGTNRIIKECDIPNLSYLQAVVKETMRTHPSGPLLRRQCNKDSRINGYDIKAGSRIIINLYAIMRDSNVWTEPEKFLPERFLLVNNKDNVGHTDLKGHQDFRFLPFGSGRRACPGSSYALTVVHTVLGALVQCFDWKVKDEDKIDIKLVTGYSGAMALPFVCYPIARFDPFKA